MARDIGVPRKLALECFDSMLAKADRAIAHSYQFDRKLMRIAWYREHMDADALDHIERYCTMIEGRRVVGSANGASKLVNMVRELCSIEMSENAHSAMADTLACRQVYLALKPEPPKPRKVYAAPPKPLIAPPASTIIAGHDAPLNMTPGRPVTEKTVADPAPFNDDIGLGEEGLAGLGI